jgi:hypothetical protein
MKSFYTSVSNIVFVEATKSSLDRLELIPDSLDERDICLIVALCTQTGFGIFSLIVRKVDLKKMRN